MLIFIPNLNLKMTVDRSKRRSLLAFIFITKSITKNLLIRILEFLFFTTSKNLQYVISTVELPGETCPKWCWGSFYWKLHVFHLQPLQPLQPTSFLFDKYISPGLIIRILQYSLDWYFFCNHYHYNQHSFPSLNTLISLLWPLQWLQPTLFPSLHIDQIFPLRNLCNHYNCNLLILSIRH